jgi:hypothetical protein
MVTSCQNFHNMNGRNEMTPQEKINWLITATACRIYASLPAMPVYPNFPEFELGSDERQDGREEVRSSGVDTDLPSQSSRHYECKEVATELPDGTWVGWTYWYGGGKYGEPSQMDWIKDAYDLVCTPETKVVNTFVKSIKEPA